MKRLLDMPASSPLLEQAQRLIEAAPAVDDSTQQMLRIRRALDRPELSGARGALLRAPSLVLGGALVVFGASAFAAVRVWVEHRAPHEAAEPRAEMPAQAQAPEMPAAALEASQPSAAVPNGDLARLAPRASEPLVFATESTPKLSSRARVKSSPKASRIRRTKLSRPTRRTAARVASVAPALTRATEAAPVPESMPVPVDDATRTELDSIAAAPVAARVQPEPERVSQLRAADSDEAREPREEREQVAEPGVSAPAKRSSDSELVVHAVRALRRDGDPEAALRLLERYRSRNPSGVLAEEVLSLQIEAAHGAHGANEARAAAFAREYLSRYPEGRYRARARRALAGEAP